MEENEKTIAYRIQIDSGVWTRFKEKTPKSMTMNERICRMIYDAIGEQYPGDGQSNKKPTKK
jgi:hypothetical protein